jgi:hypothetical protein
LRGLKVVVAALRKLSRPAQTRLEKARVETIFPHQDPESATSAAPPTRLR